MDASAGPVEGTISKTTVPGKTTDEQPHGNGFHMDTERMGPKLWKECLVPTVSNSVDGPQVTISTAPTLIFTDKYHWITHEGTTLPLLILRLLLLLLGLFTNMDQTIVLPDVSIQKQACQQTL